MARSNAVQFRGIPAIINAYELNNMPPFAVKSGPQILYASETKVLADGSDELREYLKLVMQGGSEAYYTLCVYKLKEGEDITDKTPINRSFNFTLFDVESLSPYQAARGSFVTEVKEEMAELRELVLELTKRKEEEKEPVAGIAGLLNGLVDNPEFKNAIAMKAIDLMNSILPAKKKPIGAIGGVQDQQQMQSVLTPEQVAKVQKALNVLCAKDPQLGDNLLKVAELIMSNPAKYKMALTML